MRMPSVFHKQQRLGILGGGQLGRMLLQASANFNFHTKVLDHQGDAPCRALCNEFVQGSFADFTSVMEFGKNVDVLTIEIEHVNVDALDQLQSNGIVIYPQPEIIRTIQDKGTQKQFLRTHHLPTTDFEFVAGREDLHRFKKFFPAVQKLRKAGYDGRGVVKIGSADDLGRGFHDPSIVETHVDFEKEISVIVARNPAGEVATFRPVEMMFHEDANLVEYLLSPASITPEVEDRSVEIARNVAVALGLVGVAAVEMFLLPDESLLVNEIAPRPHNSGHHTIEANVTSQYEQHLRAIFNLPLGSTAMKSPAVMVNLLGAEGYNGPVRYEGIEDVLKIEGAAIHLYDKKLTKPFRKMGHVTILDADIRHALEKARYVRNHVKVCA